VKGPTGLTTSPYLNTMSSALKTPLSAPSTTLDTPPPPPSAPRRERPQIESAKTVLSAEIFQRRHLREFAHLHDDANTSDLAAEQRILDEERRAGRRKRESLALGESGRSNIMSPSTGRAMSVDGAATKRTGKRPLSLVTKTSEKGHNRSRTEVGLGIDLLNSFPRAPARDTTATVQQRPRSRPASLRSSLVSHGPLVRPDLIPEEQTLEVLVERNGSPEPKTASSLEKSIRLSADAKSSQDHSTSSGEKSFKGSTYSWATSFSGETTDLRTAAQYVPSRTATPDPDVSTELDSPARKEQRKKRIVAIAHTVRQLEGVGSRDLEDPTFYGVLAKAWYERFDDKVKERAQERQLGSPAHLPPTPHGDAPAPFLPDSQHAESSSAALRRFPYRRRSSMPETALSPDTWASPPDPEFKTPHQEYEFTTAHHQYPVPAPVESRTASVQSRSVRYSYASSLHDLGVEGMMQGNKLLREKAWLRPKSSVGTPWGGDFDMPPPLRAPTPEEEQHSLHASSGAEFSALDSPFEYDSQMSQPKILRRIDGHIVRPIATQRVVSTEKEVLESPWKATPTGEPAKWGLGGLVSNWWDSTPPTRAPSPERPPRQQMDFRIGEDGTIPFTRRSMSNLAAVLDPEISTPSLNIHSGNSSMRSKSLDMSVRLSPSAKMFINSLVRVPSRRRSVPLPSINRSAELRFDEGRLSRSRSSLRHRRRYTEPFASIRVDPTGSAFSNHYLAKSAATPSTTSSPVFLVPPPSCATGSTGTGTASTPTEDQHAVRSGVGRQQQEEDMEVLQPETADESDEDGLTGLESWSLRSISPLPTPPRDEAPFDCQIPPIYPLPTRPTMHERRTARPSLIIIPPRALSGLQMPVQIQATIEESEDSWSATGHRVASAESIALPRPYQHLATSTPSNCAHPDYELLSCLPWCGPACPLQKTQMGTDLSPTAEGTAATVGPAQPRLPARLSSLPSPVLAKTPTRPDRPDSAMGPGLGLSGSGLGNYDAARRPGAIRTSTMNSGSMGPIDWRRTQSPITRIAIDRSEPKQRTATKVLFWLGFIFPFLWLVGAWPSAPEEDVEVGSPSVYGNGKPSRGARVVARLHGVREAPTSWWRRWAWHPDVFVERCRWALAVAVPLCLIGGAVAAIVLSVK